MRPYNRHQTHGERATPATRAKVDSILARLNEESPYASMLHEEIPDWLIERRPARPAPRPVPKPKEKAVIRNSDQRLADWAAKTLAEPPAENPKPKRGKPHPKTDLEEPARAEVAAALKRAGRGPCSVSAELFKHTGMAQWLKTGKGLSAHNVAIALEWARNVPTVITFDKPLPDPSKPRKQVVAYFANGEAVHEWVDVEEEPPFDPEPYPETTTNKVELTLSLDTAEAEASIARVRAGLDALAPDPNPYQAMFGPFLAEFVRYKLEGMGVKNLDEFSVTVLVERK